ncbi:hypothetical protein BH09PAT2_BH09PAT2_07530 [soil metagenome]
MSQEGSNTFAIATEAPVVQPKQEVQLPTRPSVDKLFFRKQESRIANSKTAFDAELIKSGTIVGITTADDGQNLQCKSINGDPYDHIPLNLNGNAPHISEKNGQIMPALVGEKGASAIVGIKMRSGNDFVCMNAKGEEVRVPMEVLRQAQTAQTIEAGKAEPNGFTPEENDEMNKHLVENGFISTDSMAISLEKNKKALPTPLAPEADEATQEKYQQDLTAAETYNAEADALSAEIKRHGIMTESDLGEVLKFQGKEALTQMQQRIAEIQLEVSHGIDQVTKLASAGQPDFGIGARVTKLQAEQAQLQAAVENYTNPEKIAELYAQTRSPEIAKQINELLVDGDTDKMMDVMIDAQLAKITNAEEQDAARKKMEALRDRSKSLALSIGGGAAILLYLMFVEGIKQQ